MKKTETTQSMPDPNFKPPTMAAALVYLEKTAREVADSLCANKIGWYGEEAVAAALVEFVAGNLGDNAHDDPEFYVEMVGDILGRGVWDHK